MSKMDISLSRDHLRRMVEHVVIGNWIMEGIKVAPDEKSEVFLETILSIGKSYGVMDGIEFDEKSGRHALSQEKEDELMQRILDYEEDGFLQNLVYRLGERDALEKHGAEKLARLEGAERLKLIWAEEEKYGEEFEKRGIERLRLRKP